MRVGYVYPTLILLEKLSFFLPQVAENRSGVWSSRKETGLKWRTCSKVG
jgi:hypothetical protein